MKKSNYLVFAISVLASIFLLYLWYSLGFNKIDSPLDLAISVVWWIVIVVLVVLINLWEQKRQQAIRTVYLSDTALYNSETGVRELSGAAVVDAVEKVLSGLEYGFETKDAPAKDKFDYRYVVKSEEYKTANGNSEPTWKGSVITIDRENGNVEKTFSNKAELVTVLGTVA